MKYMLGLSGENVLDGFTETFAGVSLLRGEYLCRRLDVYITTVEWKQSAEEYLSRITRFFAPVGCILQVTALHQVTGT